MEVDQVSSVLHSILSSDELQTIPETAVKKIEDACEKKFEEFLTAKALCETRKTDLEKLKLDYEQKIEELTLKAEDESAKYHSSQLSVKEMRIELEDAKQELIKAKEKLSSNEAENIRFRKERNQALTERDTMDSALKRKELEVDRLHHDVLELEKKLKAANGAKCEALTRLEEIVSKEHSLEFKEKRMDQELSLRDNQIARLTRELDQAMRELQSIRRDQNIKSLTVETKLSEKMEELKLANQTIGYLSEQNGELSAKVEELAAKNMKLTNETSSLMEQYRKELESQNRLCGLLQQDKNDQLEQTKELEAAITSLRQMVNEATESCGTIETEKKQLELKHAEELANRDKTIGDLQEELKRANELLAAAREENIEHAVEMLAPTAAATSRMIKTGMSLTEVYTQYVSTMESLQQEQKENGKLKLQLQNILQELEQSAPEIARQQTENQNLRDANEELAKQLHKMVSENGDVRSEMAALAEKLRNMEAANTKLRQERSDLSRQICHLLNELERMQSGVEYDADQSFPGSGHISEVISKKLVTFSNIQELQDNNVKLLLLVRDFSSKLEEMEKIQNSMSAATYEAKLEACNKRIQELKDTVDKNRSMLEQCTQQRDRYKKMYHDAMRSYNPAASASLSMNGQGDSMMLGGDDESVVADRSLVNDTNGGNNSAGNSSSTLAAIVAEKERKVAEYEGKVRDLQKEMATVKEEYESFRREKLANDKLVNEQFDKMRTEISELMAKNVKLTGAIDFNAEQNRMLVKNISTYKNQITTLEERNRNYESTIAKQEASIMFLKDDAMGAQSKLARAEVQLENLRQECRILKDSESRLQTEREILNRERCNQNLLLNNLEMIKVSMERSENEGRLRLEQRLDETSRECSALRRRLQEEQDRFREQMAHLQRQVETAQKRMDEEIAIAEGLQAELRDARDELEIKTRKNDDLQRKLQETLSPNDEDNPVTQAKRRVRELEQQLAESVLEVESLQGQLATAQQHIKQYTDLAESAEKELKDLTDLHQRQKETSDGELQALRKSEQDLRAQVEELKTELSLKIAGAQLQSTGDKQSELHKVQLELKGTLEKVAEQNRELRELRDKCNALTEQVHLAEQKYAREMAQHSSDIQQLAQLKEDTQRIQAQFDELRQQRDQAQERLKTSEECWTSREQMLRKEASQLEEQLDNLNAQNAALHDQIQSLSTRLSINAAALNQSATSAETLATASADDSMSGGPTPDDCSMLNRSLTDEEKKGGSIEQLLQIMRYLRKEKDIAVARFDVLRSENVRIQSEQMLLQKKLDDAQAELVAMREKNDTEVVTAAKHEEILRKLDTYNAITDSNRVLREERDNLNQKVRELSQRLLDAEDKLFPLEEKVRELTVKLESASNENTTLRMDVARQRQRMTTLVERSSKTNSDDWKRMQTERENLAKMLMAEKDLLKHANEELNTHKLERTRLETELGTVSKQLQTCNEQVKRLSDELEAASAQAAEVETLKAKLKTTEEQLAEVRIKESQIRKIAKRYKDSFTELKRQTDEREADGGAAAAAGGNTSIDGTGAGGSGGGPSTGTEDGGAAAGGAEVEELRKQIETAADEIDTLKKENELLRAKLEKAERSMDVVKDAKNRILALTEQKNNAARELNAMKGQLQQQLDQMREEKAQYEGRMTRCEKESADADRESKDAISRLTRENEQLTIRLNQLNRQLGLQQAVAKPSTSAGVGGAGASEKPVGESPRTANVKPMAGPSQQQSATVTPRRVSETPLASIRPMAVGSRTAAVLPTSQTAGSTNVAIVQGSSAGPAPGSGGGVVNVSGGVVVAGASTGSAVQGTNNSSAVGVSAAASGSGGSASSSNTVTTTQAGHKRPRDVEGDSSTDTVGQQLANKPTPAKKRIRMVQVTADGFQGVSESGLDVEYQVPTSSQRDQEDDIIVVDSEEEEDDDDDDEDEEEEEDVGMVDEGTAEADDGPFDAYETEELGVAGDVGAYEEGEGPDIDEDNNIQSANNEVDVDEDNELANPCGTTSTTSSASAKQMTLSGAQHAEPMDTTADVETSSTSSTTNAAAGGSSGAVAGPSTSMESSSSSSPVESGASTSSTSGAGNTSNDAQQLPHIQSTTGVGQSEASAGSSQQSSSSSSVALPSSVATSSGAVAPSQAAAVAGSSGVAGSGSSSARQIVNPLSRQQQQAAHLMLMQQNYEHHESADDRIVPSTPTLYAPRRTDGFSVGSPHPQVPTARFTFGETSTSSRQTVGVVPTSGGSGADGSDVGLPEGIDDTRIDLSQLDDGAAGVGSGSGRSVPTTPQHTTHPEQSMLGSVAMAGPSSSSGHGSSSDHRLSSAGGESQVPDILVSGASVGDGYIPESTTSSSSGIDPLLGSYSSSEAQASGSDVGTASLLERSERELLGEDDDDDDDIVDDGVVDRGSRNDPSVTLAAADDVDDDVDADVDMEDVSSKTSTSTSTTTTTTTTATPTNQSNVAGARLAAAAESKSATAVPSTSAASSESTPTAAGAHGSRRGSGGSGLTKGYQKKDADVGAGDDGVSSEGEKLNTSVQRSPMEESSEAEVLETPSSNTRSRTSTQRVATNVSERRGGGRRYGARGGNRTPITWNDGRCKNVLF
uniref:Nucleoprotein TPR n=1 Tax=Anopheles farauti TaxID=69004 RepID=A0A182QGG3_9DIPT